MSFSLPLNFRGVGLHVEHYSVFEREKPKSVSFIEVISENLMPWSDLKADRAKKRIEAIRKDYELSLHGVSLNIGSIDPLNKNYLSRLRTLADELAPFQVSDHLCFTGIEGKNTHDLLPLPYTEETLSHLISKISEAQEFLGRALCLENVSSYISYESSQMREGEFLRELSLRSGCRILLDINNIYVSAKNHGFDPLVYLNDVTGANITQFHLAGHDDHGEIVVDTHGESVPDAVWALYGEALDRFGHKPTLLERDANIPQWQELEKELAKMGGTQ